MSREISIKLDNAKDEVEGLQSSYDALVVHNSTYRTRRNAFGNFMTATTEFVADKIDDVFSAMDDAVDEIDRLDDVVEELTEKIKELESRVEGIE